MDSSGIADYRSVIGYFTNTIMRELRLVWGYDILYGKVKQFIMQELFATEIDIESQNTLRNISEVEATKTIIETLKKGINELTVTDKGTTEIRDTIKLRKTRPFITNEQESLPSPKKTVFNMVVGDSHFELVFASFLEKCADIVSYTKNHFAINFKIDYVNANGDIANYYPDFIVKLNSSNIVIVETKGLSDLDVPLKMERLKKWCDDVNAAQDDTLFNFVFVEETEFTMCHPDSFSELLKAFTKYK